MVVIFHDADQFEVSPLKGDVGNLHLRTHTVKDNTPNSVTFHLEEYLTDHFLQSGVMLNSPESDMKVKFRFFREPFRGKEISNLTVITPPRSNPPVQNHPFK